MKRKSILVLLLSMVCLLLLVARWLLVDPNAPRFLPSRSATVVAPYTSCTFPFAATDPFAGGKMWISTSSGANDYHAFYFDIARGTIVGELMNGVPCFMNHDQSKVLCVQRARSTSWLRIRFNRLIERVSRGRIRFPSPNGNVERVWLVDVNRNSASVVGELPLQFPGDAFLASPDFRYCAASSLQDSEVYLCDVDKGDFRKANMGGMPLGWWDNSNIIVRDTNDNLILYDVPSGKTTDFLSAARLTKFLEEMQIWDERPGAVSLLCDWNGRENEFYLADTEKRLQAGTSFLIKIERPGAALKLLNREFKFEWQGELDRAGTRYVYSGRLPGQGISGVYLRDVTAKTNRMLVIPDNDTAFTHPRLFRDSLIYLKSNMLWRIDLNGSNRTRLFPPR